MVFMCAEQSTCAIRMSDDHPARATASRPAPATFRLPRARLLWLANGGKFPETSSSQDRQILASYLYRDLRRRCGEAPARSDEYKRTAVNRVERAIARLPRP